jgi:putative transposase
VQELLLQHGITVSQAILREWSLKFVAPISFEIQHRCSRQRKTWYSDEMRLVVQGMVRRSWRAVDEHGFVLDIVLQDERDTSAAKRFFEKLLEGLEFIPLKIVTDGLGSYQAALADSEALEGVKHVFVKSEARLSNRMERDHEHVREKQRASRGWRSPPDQLEMLLRCRDFTRNVFKRKRATAGETRNQWHRAFQVWGEVLSSVTLG